VVSSLAPDLLHLVPDWSGPAPAGTAPIPADPAQALRQVRAYLEKNGEAQFTWWHRVMDDRKPNTALRAGFKRMVDEAGQPVKYDSAADYCDARAPADERSTDGHLVEFLILPEAFRNEVCKGLDAQFVAKVLKDSGYLKTDRDRFTHRLRVPGIGNAPVFHVLPAVFALGDEEE
jgi:putative DNA primase/helicase